MEDLNIEILKKELIDYEITFHKSDRESAELRVNWYIKNFKPINDISKSS